MNGRGSCFGALTPFSWYFNMRDISSLYMQAFSICCRVFTPSSRDNYFIYCLGSPDYCEDRRGGGGGAYDFFDSEVKQHEM